MKICPECYSGKNRITPLLDCRNCLVNHTQYICGTCGRCICIEYDAQGLQRWKFPFSSPDIAKLYLRAAEVTMKRPCGIYELKNSRDRVIYKIFAGIEELMLYLKKHKDKVCEKMSPVCASDEYRVYSNSEMRRLTVEEADRYLADRLSQRDIYNDIREREHT